MGISRRERDAGRSQLARTAGPRSDFSPAGSGRPVIYRAEPSPSLTPLLRNYTQSVANKSKKVSAALVPIHGTSALVPRLASRAKPGSPPLSRSVRTSAANSIEILVQIARALVVPASRSREIRASPIARFGPTLPIFVAFVRLRGLNRNTLNL